MHGQFVWYELMTPDSEAARTFYPAVTAWGTEDWDKDSYSMWTANGEPIGGIVQLRPDHLAEGMRPMWMPYIEVDAVDSAAARLSSLGGTVLFGPKDIPGTGRFAVVADPQGATFAIHTPQEPAYAFDGTRTPGRFVWHELITTNPDAAFQFYSGMFGWVKTNDFDMGPNGKYQMYGHGTAEYGGIYKLSPEWGASAPQWICYAHVPDVRKATTAAARAGAKVMIDYMEVPGGDIIGMMTDPQGALFAVHQQPAKPAPKKPATVAGAKRRKAHVKAKPKARPKAKQKARSKAKPQVRGKARKPVKSRRPARKTAVRKSKRGRRR
ncbi:MAG: VOC family protein [Gemmatimonadaceae bacterium]